MLTPEQVKQYRDQYGITPENPTMPSPEERIANMRKRVGLTQPPATEPSFFDKAKNFTEKYVIPSEKAFGESIAGAILPHTKAGKEFEESQAFEQQQNDQYITIVANRLKKKKDRGEDTSRELEQLKNAGAITGLDSFDFNPALGKSTKKILGEALGVAVDIASFGTFGAATKAPVVAKTTTEAMKQGFIRGAVKSAPIGAGFGAASAMQDDEDLGGIISRTLTSGAVSGVIGGALEGVASRKQIDPKVLRQEAIAQYKRGLQATKEKMKEKSEKIIPELLDEGWWGTRKKLLERAEKGIALAQDEYEKLGELKGVVDSDGIVDRIHKEMEKLGTRTIGDDGETVFRVFSVNEKKVKALQKLKADILATQAYDDLGRSSSAQQELRELAQAYGDKLYDSRKSFKTIADSDVLSQVKKVDGMIRELLNTENPEYAKINELYHLNSELADVLIETANRKGFRGLFGWNRLLETVAGSFASGVGAMVANLPGAITAGIAVPAIIEIANSTWWNTWRAVQKNRLAEKLLEKGVTEQARLLRLIANQGIKAANELIGQDDLQTDAEDTEQP